MNKKMLAGAGSLCAIVMLVVMNRAIQPIKTMAAQNDTQLSACGPRSQLPAEVASNVDVNARCFELRMYTVDTERVGTGDFNGGIDALHQRFREEEVAIFERNGAEIIGAWQDVESPDTLVYMLAYRDRAHREEVWQGFAADPAWQALRLKYNVPLQRPQVFMLSNTDYSALK